MARRLQFSLRLLLVAVTLFSLWFGWLVERARGRGRAIDAILNAGCNVSYIDGDDRTLAREFDKHFWADLKGIAVAIPIAEGVWSGDSLRPEVALHLSRINNVQEVSFVAGGTGDIASADRRRQALEAIFPTSSIIEFRIDPDV